MENNIDLLQIDIAKAREELSQESRNSIDSVNWRQIILGMNNKFSTEQLETLETETELLLCGLVETEDYPLELETRMKISKSEVSNLINELDLQIFKKIQEELVKRISENEKVIQNDKPLVFDPTFAGVPKNTQEGIARSDWKENLYKIGQKYNLSIDKMGLLEETTASVFKGVLARSQYENEIRNKVNPPEDKIKDLISEINEVVFQNIKDSMKIDRPTKNNMSVPLPPYKNEIRNEELIIKNEKNDISIDKTGVDTETNKDTITIDIPKLEIKNDLVRTTEEVDIYREHGIEIMDDAEKIPEVKKAEKPQINIISEKMFKNTASPTIVTDYSIPKINTQTQSFNRVQGGSSVNPHDPYHEQI